MLWEKEGGISVYHKESKFTHVQDVDGVYKAPTGNDGILRDHLQNLIDENRSTLICGDFNMCLIDNKNSRTTKYLILNCFKQLVKEATHIDGGHIDHVYLRSEGLLSTVQMYSPYYTAKDHEALYISFPETEE